MPVPIIINIKIGTSAPKIFIGKNITSENLSEKGEKYFSTVASIPSANTF